ncbi:MAG: AAA family ATPase [Pyrinomonadaceae bacterium]
MSEYADALAVTRLVGGVTNGEGTLTRRIREQPFAVLLFDEFEKAHDSFFDLLLQILGEGRLTDGRARVADFTNSIIVMTSNLGADRFRRARPGFRDESSGDEAATNRASAPRALAAQKHFTRAVQDFLRPEIFNRIDHIVPFLPLERDTVKSIAERELMLLQERDGVRLRGVVLRASAEAVELLARRGYDARYGARPLKRLIERELLLPLAVQLNQRQPLQRMPQAAATTLVAEVRVEANRLRVSLEEQAIERRSAAAMLAGDEASLAARAARLSELRRRLQQLERSSSVVDLRNTIWRLTEIERRLARAAGARA